MLFFVLCCVISLVLGQTTHMVTVGDGGSFYDPPTVAAGLNDIISFVFTGEGSHSVTQSTYSDPCTPLPGGFNSGLYTLSNSSQLNEAPVWNLQITDDVDPIYFFCTNTHPVSHCGSGMVGVINPPSQANYTAFVASAKAVTTSLTSQPPYAPTGSGAFALATPSLSSVGTEFLTATQTKTVSASSTSSSPSSSSTSTPIAATSSSGTSKSHTGAIVGGAVGGCLAIGLVVIAIVYILLRRHRLQQEQPASSQQLHYSERPLPSPGMTERGMNGRISVLKPNDMMGSTFAMSQAPPSPPHGYGHLPNPHYTNYTSFVEDPTQNHPGQSRLLSSQPSSDQMSQVGAGQQMGGKDINTLAKEIAAVLLRNEASDGRTASADEAIAKFTAATSQADGSSTRTMSPPHYRAEQC